MEHFSERQGLKTREVIRQGVTDVVRHRTKELLLAHLSPWGARELVCRTLHTVPTAYNSRVNVIKEVAERCRSCEWFEVYDILEALYQSIDSKGESGDPSTFENELNRVLRGENIGLRMQGGKIVYAGNEAFEATHATTSSALEASGRVDAQRELREAIADLSRRPDPDPTGAVHHAMAALGSVATNICGESGETLGQVVKRHPEKFRAPLGEVVSKLYGFASDKGRHVTEGNTPQQKEAELVVSVAAAMTTYLLS